MRALEVLKLPARLLLAAFMGYAGTGHFTNTASFLAQVPPFLPAPELIVWVSGVVEIAFAAALLLARKHLPTVGVLLAAFYIAIFPGNISQALTQTSAFGLDTDSARYVRLLFQPVLVVWALWCTDGWRQRHTVVVRLRGLVRGNPGL